MGNLPKTPLIFSDPLEKVDKHSAEEFGTVPDAAAAVISATTSPMDALNLLASGRDLVMSCFPESQLGILILRQRVRT